MYNLLLFSYSSKYAEEKKIKSKQLQDQNLRELRNAANTSKIDLNSQKLILKKKERALQYILSQCIDEEQTNDTLSAKGVMDFLTKLGLFKENDNDFNIQTFNTKRQSVQRLMNEQHIFNSLWKILSLQDEEATEIQVEFLFDIIIVLLETQLSQSQAIDIILNQVKIELKKFIEMEENDFEKQKDEECLNQCINSLRPLLQSFVSDFRTIYDTRKTIINERLNIKIDKKIEQEFFSFKPQINEKSRELSTQTSSTQESRYIQLFDQAKQIAEKKEILKQEQSKNNEPNYPFKPKINDYQNKRTDEKRYDRLYGFAQKFTQHKEQLKEYYESKKEQSELEQCTFKPQTTGLMKTKIRSVKGEQQVIERLAKARKMKEDKENFYAMKEQQNRKHDPTKITQPQPFSVYNRNSASVQKKVLLNIDIRVSKNKKVRISIREGDDPKALAATFATIHQLNEEMQATLEETLIEYLEAFQE